jgi:hypothetical protein
MIDINNKNFNNPENLQLSDSYSVISSTLNNPYIAKTIDYGDFRSADPVLNSMLPSVLNLGMNNGNANNMKDVINNKTNFNYGLTSPGFVDNAMKCTGLDFVNTNPDYDKLPFQVCLNKFNSQYRIPEMTFNNLINNLPYTFSALSPEEKRKYLSKLENFINTESVKNGIDINNLSGKNTKNGNLDNHEIDNNANDIDYYSNTKEYFESESNGNSANCSNSGLSLSGVLCIILVIIIILIFLLFITNKK